MPHLRIETNVPKNVITQDFILKAGAVIAKTLGKPDQVTKLFISHILNQ